MITRGIYRIVNKTNGKFYVGSSDDIQRRFSRHKLDLSKNRHDNPHLQNAWNKYGDGNFEFEVVRQCAIPELLVEEQKDLDIWVGKKECYNIRADAKCPVAPGSHRPEWVKEKISAAQRGKPKWTEEQKKQMSIDRMGRKPSAETIQKLRDRPKSCYTGIVKAQQLNVGRIYSDEHCLHISNGKQSNPKIFTDEERIHIKDGVRKAILEGRYHKNKIPKEEYEIIRTLYLSGGTNKRQLAFKYGITPTSMSRLLKRIGI